MIAVLVALACVVVLVALWEITASILAILAGLAILGAVLFAGFIVFAIWPWLLWGLLAIPVFLVWLYFEREADAADLAKRLAEKGFDQ